MAHHAKGRVFCCQRKTQRVKKAKIKTPLGKEGGNMRKLIGIKHTFLETISMKAKKEE